MYQVISSDIPNETLSEIPSEMQKKTSKLTMKKENFTNFPK